MQANQAVLPRQLYRAASVRQLDRSAIEGHGISGIQLMRRAGRAAFELLRECWPEARSLALFCGAGNNGGDAYILAARALQCGYTVRLFQLQAADRLQGDARAAYDMALDAGVQAEAWDGQSLADAEVIVDGLLGTGLRGEVREPYRQAIDAINDAPQPVLALDIPSGLCSDTGVVLGAAVSADQTISFIGLKQGMLTGDGQAYCGELHYSDLSVPSAVLESLPADSLRMDASDVCHALPPRRRSAHKGSYGHVLVIGGDHGMGGAALLAARAAGRCGAGLVSLATRPQHVAGVMAQAPEVMCHGVNSGQELEPLLARPTVIVIGPGLGRQPWAEQMLQRAWGADKPLVVDADALNILSEGQVVPAPRRSNWIITPHPGEAARLLRAEAASLQADRFAAAAALQERYGAVVVLKGSGTLVADGSSPIGVCPYGNPGMASGGMGDVLSGVAGALLAQGHKVGDSARLAVVLHALAADAAAREGGQRGLLAGDLLPWLRRLVNSV